jgi:hypothetical protein
LGHSNAIFRGRLNITFLLALSYTKFNDVPHQRRIMYTQFKYLHSDIMKNPTMMGLIIRGHYTVKKFIDFPVPSLDVTDQTLPGREKLNYSRPLRVWLVTPRLGTGKNRNLFYSVGPTFDAQCCRDFKKWYYFRTMFGYGNNQSCPHTVSSWKITSYITGPTAVVIADPSMKVTCLQGKHDPKI